MEPARAGRMVGAARDVVREPGAPRADAGSGRWAGEAPVEGEVFMKHLDIEQFAQECFRGFVSPSRMVRVGHHDPAHVDAIMRNPIRVNRKARQESILVGGKAA